MAKGLVQNPRRPHLAEPGLDLLLILLGALLAALLLPLGTSRLS
jgi:hypothetical protein